MLKYFSERIPAAFVYAGIDVECNGLSGTRGEPTDQPVFDGRRHDRVRQPVCLGDCDRPERSQPPWTVQAFLAPSPNACIADLA
jgi:hypothetical protein